MEHTDFIHQRCLHCGVPVLPYQHIPRFLEHPRICRELNTSLRNHSLLCSLPDWHPMFLVQEKSKFAQAKLQETVFKCVPLPGHDQAEVLDLPFVLLLQETNPRICPSALFEVLAHPVLNHDVDRRCNDNADRGNEAIYEFEQKQGRDGARIRNHGDHVPRVLLHGLCPRLRGAQLARILGYRLGSGTLAHLLSCLTLHVLQILAWYDPKVLLYEKCKEGKLETDQRISDWQINDGKTTSH